VPANRETAENQIMQLRKGTLVVRLKTNSKSIAAYRAAGKNKLADKLENENRQRNLYFMLAFVNQFTFCPVVFIEAGNTPQLRHHDKNIYLDGRLHVDSTIQGPKGYYLLAEFGQAQQTEEGSDPRHSQVSSTPGTSAALVICDSDLNQLKEPFPYSTDMVFAKLNTSSIVINPPANADSGQVVNEVWLPSPYDKAVARLSNRLEAFYDKVTEKRHLEYYQWLSLADKPAFEHERDSIIQVIQHELLLMDAEKERFTK
jgi:hypothetical protein